MRSLLTLLLIGLAGCGDESPSSSIALSKSGSTSLEEKQTAPAADVARDEWSTILQEMGNHNSPPPIHRPHHHRTAIYPANYDWSEQERIRNSWMHLLENARGAFPALVEHLDDERYCLTMANVSDETSNYTVAGICRITIAHVIEFLPGPQTYEVRFFYLPGQAADLKRWFEPRRQMSLADLQREYAETVIDYLKPDGEFDARLAEVEEIIRPGESKDVPAREARLKWQAAEAKPFHEALQVLKGGGGPFPAMRIGPDQFSFDGPRLGK